MKNKETRLTAFRVSLLAAMVASASMQVQAQEGDKPIELDAITVTAEAEGPVGPDAGYKVERSLTATKTDTPLSETPRSVSVVTREQIEDQGAKTLAEILMYTAGTSPVAFAVHDALAGDIFYIRGVNQRNFGYGLYRDGLRVQPNAYTTSTEPYGLERVEVLKGPTSILYGENVPGGLVNLVSKRPTDTPRGEVNLSYGTFDHKEFSTDVSGSLTSDGSVKGRMVALVRDADTQTDSVPNDRIFLAPSLTFELTDQDTLTLLALYQKDDTEIQTGLPAAGTLLEHPNGGKVDTGHSLGHPEWDTFEREFWSLGYEYEHLFNDQWSFRQNARYLSSNTDRNEVWWSFPPAGLMGANGDGFDDFVVAYGRDREDEAYMANIDNQLLGKFSSGGMENTFLAGISFDKNSYDQNQLVGQAANGEVVPLDIFSPQWPSEPQATTKTSDGEIKQDLAGAYAQIQTKVGGFVGLLGGRFDWAKSELDNRINPAGSFDTTDQEFTWQTGLMYQFDNGLSPYVSYATSFVPVQQIQSASSGPLDPITGDQYEVGLKYEPVGRDILVTAAYFDLTKEDDAIYDPNAGEFRQVGETRSKGAELEVRGDVNDNLSVSAAYAYTDARITKDAGSFQEGKQMVTVPRHQGSVWANYNFRNGPLNGLETGLGVRYLGSSYAYPQSTYGTLKTDGATLVDMLLGYQFNPQWRATVNARNLLGEEYIAECNNAGRCYWGAERTVIGTVSYRW